jgi:CubicO group peptidase (beta-lactamase class C family)
VAAGELAGAIVIASTGSRTTVTASAGVSDEKSKTPLNADTVLWLASMSKPITAAAILILQSEGKLKLTDPVAKYLPEFRSPAKVRVPKDGSALKAGPPMSAGTPASPMPPMDMVAATRPITIKDLLTHTSGLQSIGIPNEAVPQIMPGDTLASWVPKLASVPLDFQPGSKWAYSNAVGFDVLSRIVEVASGEGFDVFVKRRILAPLDISTVGFRGQLSAYADRMPPVPPALAKDERLVGTTFFSGAAGMYGSLKDYLKFAQMLANDGKGPHGRILEAAAVKAMRANQTEGLFHSFNGHDDVQGMAFGYSVAIVQDAAQAGVAIENGSYGWDGAGGTRFWVMPGSKRVEVMFVPKPEVRSEIERELMGQALH